MKSAAIHFFSGTGNTARAAGIVERKLRDAGYSVDVFRVSNFSPVPLKKYDLSIFAFPVYALDIPNIMVGYLKCLPEGRGMKAAVITSFGNWSPNTPPGDAGCCLTRAANILRSRGYDVFYTNSVGYSVNWTSLLNTPTPEDNEANRKKGDAEAMAIADRIIAGEGKIRKPRLVYDVGSRAFGTIFSLFGRQSIGLMYAADDRCNGCGLCSRSCPAGAITLANGKPEWNLRCEGCQRCINACPRTAIQTSLVKLLIVLALELVSVLAFILLFFLPYELILPNLSVGSAVLSGALIGSLAAFILWFVVFVVLIIPLTYWTLRAAGRIPGAQKAFNASISEKHRRYLDPGFNVVEVRKGTEKHIK